MLNMWAGRNTGHDLRLPTLKRRTFKRAREARMKLVCKAHELKERITEAWKAEVKQAFAAHHDYINSLSHTEYLAWKRRRRE